MIRDNNKEVGKDNKKQLMASVVVITYNHEKYIAQALQSVLNQKTCFDYEIIVGDDASTDNTLQIVRDFQKRYPEKIHVIAHTENVGASRNSYDCMKECRGKYLASCEGDDYWIDDVKLQTQVDFLESHSEYIGCSHPVLLVDENNKTIKNKKLGWTSDKREFTIKDFKGINLPGHIVSLVRRNLFLEPGFDPVIIYQADPNIADRTNLLLWLSRGNYYRLDAVMACYRRVIHGKNLTSKLYFDNVERIKRDYKYTVALEKYSYEVLGVDAGFEYHKRELFVKSVLLRIAFPRKYDLETAKQIIREADNPSWYYFGFLPVVLRLLKNGVFR